MLGFVGFRNLLWLSLNHSVFLQSAVMYSFTHTEVFRVLQFLSSLIEVIGKFKPCTVNYRYDLHVT